MLVGDVIRNFDDPPPNTNIYTQDWEDTPLDVRRKFWSLWFEFRLFSDGTFDSRLRDILSSRDMNQATLADLLGFSSSTVNRWFSGRKVSVKQNRNHIPHDMSIVQDIIKKLGCDADEGMLLIRSYALEVLWLRGFPNE